MYMQDIVNRAVQFYLKFKFRWEREVTQVVQLLQVLRNGRNA